MYSQACYQQTCTVFGVGFDRWIIPRHYMYAIYVYMDPFSTTPTDRQSYGSPRRVVFGIHYDHDDHGATIGTARAPGLPGPVS